MSSPTRGEAQLVLAGIRVLTHRLERAPTPEELAELLEQSPSAVRLRLSTLADLGAVVLVESAFETHAEVGDHLLVEQLPEEAGPAITEDLKAFDDRKRAETERMAHLFDSGDQDKRRRRRHEEMDADLDAFKNRKPRNPFGED